MHGLDGWVSNGHIDRLIKRERAKDGLMATEWIGWVERWLNGWRGCDGWTDG